MSKAFPGSNKSQVSVSGSKSMGLSFFNENGEKLIIENAIQPFLISIPMLTSLPKFLVLNKTNSSNSMVSENLLTLDGFILNRNNVSIHYQIKPTNNQTGYFAALKFGENPYLSGIKQQFDLWNIFCPQSSKFIINIY